MTSARLTRVVGALCEATPFGEASLHELVEIGPTRLLGEVLRVRGEVATLQVFEETSGLALEETVRGTGMPLSIELGPGLLGSALDGIGRPLAVLAERQGNFIGPGAHARTLDADARWIFRATCKVGDHLGPGDIVGTVEERGSFLHRILVPAEAQVAVVTAVHEGERRLDEPVVERDAGAPITLSQRWPVRRPRPNAERLPTNEPLITGQRVFDLFFPVAQGGTVAVPGGFGTGKTIIEQSLAKYAEADIIVYVACGERGNEMAELLGEFSELRDPRNDRLLLDRTVLVVNTSNMPVAARESSVYLGLTIAEYFRDQGYRVAVMADSLSRWAEALREIGARLQEMPGEEGYPTYLASRLAQLYERAGRVRCLGSPERRGAVTFISAISPPGGDFSEPVTQASLRVVGALWALDAGLAHQRQFPAVDGQVSYSLYADALAAAFSERVAADWPVVRSETLTLLQRERELRDVAQLVGKDALEDKDRLLLEAAATIREVVPGQSAFDPNDAYSELDKTYLLASLALETFHLAQKALEGGETFAHLPIGELRSLLVGLRDAPADERNAAATRVRQVAARLQGGAP